MVVGERIWNIFSIYAPQVGRPDQEKIEFWENFEDKIGQIPESEVLLIGGDVNSHIGSDNVGYEAVIGRYGYGTKNNEGETVMGICQNHGLRILNTLFPERRGKAYHL